MLLLILLGIGYTIWFDSLAVAILTASLILFRAQRPSRLTQRLRDAWYAREAARVGEE